MMFETLSETVFIWTAPYWSCQWSFT